MRHRDKPGESFTIAGNAYESIPIGTLSSILRKAGLK